MPVNEVADKVHNFFEQDDLSRVRHQSQVPSGNWSSQQNLWVGNHRAGDSQLSPNVKTYGAHQSDSERVIGRGSPQVPVGTNPTHLTSRIEFAKSQSINQQLSLNGFVPENQGFQTNQNQAVFEFLGEDTVSDKRSIMPGTLPVTESRQGNGTEYQSIMTRNLGLMETFEAPTKFGFLDGQQQLTRSQQLGMPQSQTRQHQGFNEMQLWQQNLRIKQLQGLQRQQQQFHLLEQAGRQRNQTNQPPLIVKHAVREQLPDAVNGIPVHINLAQRGGSPAVQVSVNSPLLSHERGQVVRSVGLGNQQFGQSLYGTPVVSTRGTVNQFPYQGFSRYTDDMLNEAGENQVQRHMVSAAFDNSFHGNQSAVHQGQESQRREGPDGWSGNLDEQALTRIGPSQGPVSLDPTEREILFGTDENLWEAPLGGSGSMDTRSFGNSLGGTDCFPSLQSGRWSALMQSAVGEASSGDTRLQDEWNGFSCQSERSTGNLPATLDGVQKEQLNLVGTNMKTAPLISRSSVIFDDANMGQNSSSIHGFPQQDKKLSFQQDVIVQRNASYQSFHGRSEEAGQRYDQTAKQNQIEGTRQVEASMFVQNARERAQDGHIYGLSESSVHPAGTELNAHKLRDSWVNRKSTPSYNSGDANSSEQKSWNTNDSPSQSGDAAAKNIPDNLSTIHLSQRCDQESGGTHTEKDNDVGRWNISDNHIANSFRSSTGLRDSETPNAPSPQFQGYQLTSAQGFGLRLGPPSQGFPVPNKAFTSLNSSQMANGLNPRQVETEVGERSGMWSSSLQTSRPSRGMSQGGNQDDELDFSGQLRNGSLNMHEKFSEAYVSGAFYPRNVLQHKQMSSESGLDLTNHSFDRNPTRFKQQNDLHNGPLSGQFAAASLPGATTKIPPFSYEPLADPSQPTKTNLLNARVSGLEYAVMDAVTASQPTEMPGMTQQRVFSAQRSVWNSLPYQHELASGQPEKVLFQYKIPNNDPPTILSATEMSDGQDVKKGSNGPSDYGTCSVNSQHSFADDPLQEKNSCQHKSPEQVDLTPQTSDASHGTAAVGVCALEQEDTKGRCGKDTELVSETNQGSLLTSVNNNKQIEAFGCSLNPSQGLQQNYSQLRQDQAVKCVETDPTQNDFKRFKGANCDLDVQGEVATAGKQLFDEYNAAARETADNEMNTAECHILFPSGEVPNTMSSSEPPIGDIPPQNRAIFSQQSYQIHSGLPSSTSGWSKHHQMASSVIEQHRMVNGQPQNYDTPETTRTDTEQFILGKASKSLHGDISTKQISNVSLTIVESKKRKSATLEILPWHKQVAHGSQRLQSISLAEQDWVQAANRLIEKLEHETEMSEDGQLLLRSRRRLILTTRLMQQLLCPPSAAILSSDATSVYESATYVVAKLALGDACSLVSYSVNDSHVAPKKENRRSTRFENSKRPSNLYISEVVENFISRAKKLESDLLRLEKKPSILDIRVESRDQERFSVLNRFAKFHGGGNTNAASSSSTQKIRYVIACRMPRKVPQGVQCFPL